MQAGKLHFTGLSEKSGKVTNRYTLKFEKYTSRTQMVELRQGLEW